MIDGYRIRNGSGRFWSKSQGWGLFKDSTEFTSDVANALVMPEDAVIRMDCDLANEFIHAGGLVITRQGILTQDWESDDGRLVVNADTINHGPRHTWYMQYLVAVDDEIVVSTRYYAHALRATLLHLYGEVIV